MHMKKNLFRSLSRFLKRKNMVVAASLCYYNQQRKLPDDHILDYIRTSTLELAATEIEENKLRGSIAEVGVFKGEFACRLNKVFPDRILYLFDTFEGFDKRDADTEKRHQYSSAEQDFSDTSVELVLAKMQTPEQCIVRRGFFPETARDLEDEFVFVSLDADLYDPIMAGLNYFYPRLVKGGYIFIHDYNNFEYRGARRAVKDFCSQNGLSIVPIADVGGTAILTK